MTLLTEIGDIRRFARPTGLMAFAGLVPGERSSGEIRRRGPITKAGSGELRRALIETAWHYRHQAGAALRLNRRRMGQDPRVVAVAVKAQHRCQKKFRRLAKKKHPCKAVTAVARELCGFLWSAMQHVTEVN